MSQQYFELVIPHDAAAHIFTFLNERIHFNAEIEMWCRENLRYFPRKTVKKMHDGDYNSSYYCYVLEIIDETDLILFKMRWL